MDMYEEESTVRRRPQHAAHVKDAVGQEIQARMAAMQVRRKCNQPDHACKAPSTSRCEHPNHRRDADLLLSTDRRHPGMLDMLGLSTDYPAYEEAERRTWLKWLGQAGPDEDNA